MTQTLPRLQPLAEPARPIAAGASIGHVHLKVADIQRALDFYCGVLGFSLMQRYGADAAFISAGGYHHHIGLNTWESRGGKPEPGGDPWHRNPQQKPPRPPASASPIRP